MARSVLAPVLAYKPRRGVGELRRDISRFSAKGKTLLPQLQFWRTIIFRVDLLRTLDFIGSEHRRQSTTRNIPELGISAENSVKAISHEI